MASVCSNCGAPSQPGHICNDGSEWLGKTLDGRYRIESVLGAGGMGMVFRATQTSVSRAVAVKTLNPALAAAPTFFERFKREAEVASRLRHPNVITVFDFGRAEDGTCFFVMELLEGRSLKEIVKGEGPMTIRRAVTIIEQAALGLQHAHNEGCVHRDLKPHNIMVQTIDGAEFVKVLDFGLVKAMEQEEDEQLTSTGQVLGTPQYMPPEQAGGEPVDLRSDLYSLAGVLYYCLTGSSPYGANSVRKALQMALTQPVPSVASRRVGAPVPRKLEEFFRKGLAREKEDRHQSCEEFVAEMLDAVEGLPDAQLDALPEGATPSGRESGSGSRSGARSSAGRPRTPGSRANRLGSASGSAARTPSSVRSRSVASDESRARRATEREIPAQRSRASAPPPPPARKTNWVLIAIPAVVAIAGALYFFVLRPGTPLPSAPPADDAQAIRPLGSQASNVQPAAGEPRVEARPAVAVSAPVEAVPETIDVSLRSNPAGAEVYRGDAFVGQTPVTLALGREETHVLSFKLRGHTTVKRTMNFSRVADPSTEVEVTLEPTPVRRRPTPKKDDGMRAFD